MLTTVGLKLNLSLQSVLKREEKSKERAMSVEEGNQMRRLHEHYHTLRLVNDEVLCVSNFHLFHLF